MEDIRIISLYNGKSKYDLQFALIRPGKFRIANRPLLGMRNTIVEYSKEFWMQNITVSNGLYEFVYGKRDFAANEFSQEDSSLFPWYGVDFNEVVDFLKILNEIVD